MSPATATTVKAAPPKPRLTPKKQVDVLMAAITPDVDCGCGQKSWCHGYRKGQAA